MLGEKEKQKQEVSARAHDVKKAHWLVDLFFLKLDQGLTSPRRSNLESSAFSLYFTDSTVWNLLKTSFLMDK